MAMVYSIRMEGIIVSSVSFVQTERSNIKKAIEDSLNLIDYKFQKNIKKVIIKPNMCYYWDYSTGQTTDPKFVAATIEILREKISAELDISIVESDASAMQCKYAFKFLGYEKIAEQYNLAIIEDACQAHGAEYKGKKVPFSETGCFSFYPGKNLGAYGEGGAVVTDSDQIAEKVRSLRNHGQKQKHFHQYIGYNYRMSGFQGAVLSVKLKYLDKWIDARREKAKLYNELLRGVVGTPKEAEYAKHVYHLYVIRTTERKKLTEYLRSKNISTGIHYPIPIHLQEAYSFMGLKRCSFPKAEMVSDEILSLPIYPEISEEHIRYICSNMKEFLK